MRISEWSSDVCSSDLYDAGWSDLGGWDAVWSHAGPDGDGVTVSGGATAIDCSDTLLRTDSEGMELVGIGLNNIIAVAMNDAVLIADKARSQDVKLAVEALKAKGAVQAESFPKDHRSEEHTSELQSLMRISYAVFCLKKKTN